MLTWPVTECSRTWSLSECSQGGFTHLQAQGRLFFAREDERERARGSGRESTCAWQKESRKEKQRGGRPWQEPSHRQESCLSLRRPWETNQATKEAAMCRVFSLRFFCALAFGTAQFTHTYAPIHIPRSHGNMHDLAVFRPHQATHDMATQNLLTLQIFKNSIPSKCRHHIMHRTNERQQ